MTRLQTLVLATAAASFMTTVADAHPQLKQAGPAPGSVVATSPKAIRIEFNEAVVANFSGVEITDQSGGRTKVVHNSSDLSVALGEIADEHDDEIQPGVVRQSDGSFLADARASLEDVGAIVGPEFDVGEVANDMDTLAGYVVSRVGRVPVRGELVPGPGPFELEILDADPRRVPVPPP